MLYILLLQVNNFVEALSQLKTMVMTAYSDAHGHLSIQNTIHSIKQSHQKAHFIAVMDLFTSLPSFMSV